MTDFFAQSLQAFQERMRTPLDRQHLNCLPAVELAAASFSCRKRHRASHAIYLFQDPHGLAQPPRLSHRDRFLLCRSKAMDFPRDGLARGVGDTSE